MKTILTLPFDNVDKINFDDPDIVFDMSELHFPVEKEDQNNAALLFIRNIGVRGNFDFSKCDYTTKEWFMLAVAKKHNLHVEMKALTDTWVHVIANEFMDHSLSGCECIFTDDELNKFIVNNKGYIAELRRFAISIPIVTIDFIRNDIEGKDLNIDMSELDTSIYSNTDFNMINMHVLQHTFSHPAILNLQQCNEDIEPRWYTQYFDPTISQWYGYFIKEFPYLDIMNLVMPDNIDLREHFIESLNEFLAEKIKESDEKIQNDIESRKEE